MKFLKKVRAIPKDMKIRQKPMRIITISAVLSGLAIVFTELALEIQFVSLFPLLIFCFYILYQTGVNLKNPSEQRTFRVFKIASIFMGFVFLWITIGDVTSSLFF